MREVRVTKEMLADRLSNVNWHKFNRDQLIRIFECYRSAAKEWQMTCAPDKFIPDRRKKG